MRKTIALLMALGITLSTSACGVVQGGGNGGTNGGVDNVYNVPGTNKTELKVINFNGGFGSLWIEQAAERFAELKKDETYATGKTGVYVSIDKTMTVNTAFMAGATYNVYIDERHSDITALSQSNLLLPITDIVQDTTRQGGSLESRLFPQVKGSLTGTDGEYYALPHYEGYGNLSYNYDTFETENAFFAAEDETNKWLYQSTSYGDAYLVTSKDAKRSVGPDGKAGTEDDGLPRSMEEMIILMDYLKTNTDYSPIVVSGMYPNYMNYAICALWAALAGKAQMENYYNCTGEIEVIDYSHPDGAFYNEPLFTGINYIKKPRTKKVTLTETTGYLGNDMVAKYYATAMLEIIQKEGFYSQDSYNEQRTHLQAQKTLYMGGTGVYDKAAMLVDGIYWHNEAQLNGGFDDLKKVTGKTANDLDLRVMSMPTAYYSTDEVVQAAPTLMDLHFAYTMINGNVKNNEELKKAAKDFVAFLYSEQELINFSTCTGIPRPLKYEMSSDSLSSVNSYYRRMWDLRDANGENIIYFSGNTSTFKKVKNSIKLEMESPVLKNGTQLSFFSAFQATDKNANGTYKTGTQAMFELNRINEAEWTRLLGK